MDEWPASFSARADSLAMSQFSFRFVLVDNSRSMVQNDSQRPVHNGRGGLRFIECSRYEEAVASVSMMARVADHAGTPLEVRFLSNRGDSQPIVVGKKKDDGVSLAAVMDALACEPAGSKHICRSLHEVVNQVRWIEDILMITNKQALLTILTDGEASSSDGNIIDALKPFEGLPVHIIVRLCTDEQVVVAYWRNLVAHVDVNITILTGVVNEATRVSQVNKWMTYGQHLQTVREFGIITDPPLTRELTSSEIQSLANMLLLPPETSFPNAETDWKGFVQAVRKHMEKRRKNNTVPVAWCPLRKTTVPWIDVDALASHVPDPIRPVINDQETLLWRLFAFYASNATAVKIKAAGGIPESSSLRPLPTFKSTGGKYDKKLLHQGDCWQLIEDAKLVPTIINTVRFNKLVSHRDQTEFIDNGIASPVVIGSSNGSLSNGSSSAYDPQSPTTIGAAILSFREFLGVMVSVSLGVPDKGLSREQRFLRLLGHIKDSGLLESIDEEMKYLPLPFTNSTTGNTPPTAAMTMRKSPSGHTDAVNNAVGVATTKRPMTGVRGDRQSPVTASFVTPSTHGTIKSHMDITSPLGGQQDLSRDLGTSQAQEQGGKHDGMGDRENHDVLRREQEQAVKIRAWQVN